MSSAPLQTLFKRIIYPSKVVSSSDLEKFSITSLVYQWILCSEWVPSEWEYKQLLTLWLCCSWNKLLICLAGGELAPRLSLVSPKVFSPFCHRWSFRSLPLSPLACSVGDTSFPAQSSTWLHRYYLNWTKLDNAITKFNNEMHSADNWVLNPVILHYWQICLFWYCAVLCYNLYC